MNPYAYKTGAGPFRLILKPSPAEQHWYSIDFESAYELQYPENNRAWGEYYQPGESKVPLVILLHGLGDQSMLPCKYLARYLAEHGIASFVVYLPFHSRRMTPDQQNRYPRLSAVEWFEFYRQAVINVRQVLDWAEQRPEIDKGKISIFGISLGGFVSAITMGIDERVKAGILIVMGGNSSTISQASQRYGAGRGYGRPADEYEKVQQSYRKYIVEVAEQGFDNVTPAEAFFMTDPLTFSPQLRQHALLMINARWDEAVPRAATIEFWEACGRPPILWLPTTHALIWLFYPLIRRKILQFLETNLRG